MELRYLRFELFQRLMTAYSAETRRRRMADLVRLARLRPGTRILDLGGTPALWREVPFSLDITVLNLPGAIKREGEPHHRFSYVAGDACEVHQFGDREFDLVFSNSVIEHVGGAARRRAFAREVLRLGRSYWVQTPSKWFPLEAHSGMPFWWFYSPSVRDAFLRRWRDKLPAWTEMVAGTCVLEIDEVRQLFPNAEILVERSFGLPKSYTAYRIAPR